MNKLLLTASALLALNISVALAEDDAPNFAEETLSGDWGGMRTAAAKSGFAFTGGLKVDSLRNRGGAKDGTKSVSHLDLKLAIDLEKAAGWEGTTALINVLQNAGRGPGGAHTGNFMGVTNIEVGAPTTTRLFQAWIQKSLFDDRLAVLAGLYPIDSEFFTVDSAGVFLGPQYGTPADLALTRGPSIFNNSAFGFRARWDFDKAFYAMGALLDGIPNDPRHPKHTRIRFEDGDGTFQIGEIGWLPEAASEGFTGHAKVAFGLWNYTGHEDNLADAAAGTAPVRNHRQHGGYVLGERTLYRLSEDGERFLSGFARYTWGDAHSYAVKNSLNLGLHMKGALASRPDDILGLAWTRAGLASTWRQATLIGGGTPTDSESAWELTYRAQLTPYLAVQPNAQWVRNPGGTVGTNNAKLIGVRVDLAL
jgi:porin